MVRNLASWDRWLRAIAGLALLAITATWASPFRWVTLVAAVVLVATAGVGYCPVYGACHIRTYSTEHPQQRKA